MTRPIATINPLIGDASFVARHGRLPTPADDQTERIATHLAFAERIVRAIPVPRAQQAARAELLAVLRAYIAARRFPIAEATRGRLPAFVDRDGTRCAVAALVDHAAGAAACERIDTHFHDAFVADRADDALAVLAAEAGLTRAELALIQPSYSVPPPSPIVLQADLTTEGAVDSSPGDHPVAGLFELGGRWEGQHRAYLGDPMFAIDGTIGIDSSDRHPYAAEARIGTDARWPVRAGVLAGIRVDGDGSRVPEAWTVPIDAYWYAPWPARQLHLGAVGGVALQVAGADRALGWNAGIDLALTPNVGYFQSRLWPHDFHLKLGVDHLADLTFIGLTLGVSSSSRYDPERGDDY